MMSSTILQTKSFSPDTWIADWCIFVYLSTCLRMCGCGPERVCSSVLRHIQANHILAVLHACCGSWPCFCHCFVWLCCSAILTYHYSLKYCMGGIPELPARNVAAAFVWNAENSFPSRRWIRDISNERSLFMRRGKQAKPLTCGGGYSVYLQQENHKTSQVGYLKRALRNAAFNWGEFFKA